MDSDDLGLIQVFAFIVIALFLLMGFLIGFTKLVDITCFDNIPSKVWVDNKLVYEGSSAGFDIHSSGYATTVTVVGGPLYLFPRAVYTSKDVRVEGVK